MEIFALVAAMIAIGQFSYNNIYLKIKKKRDIRIYENSASSDNDMLKDLLPAKKVSFFGLAMTSLSGFLRKVLDQNGGKKFETLDIYLANINDGKIWQGEKYSGNVLQSIKHLAHFISDSEVKKKTHRDFKIEVYSQAHHSTYAGCNIDNRIMYVVNFIAREDIHKKDGITFRLHNQDYGTTERYFYKEYAESREEITKQAKHYTRLSTSIWDDSIIQWDHFVSNCDAYFNYMKNVVSSLNLSDGLNVLEVACGNGMLGDLIQNNGNKVNLFLTDNCGQMLKLCERILDHKNTEILYFDPVENSYNWDMFFPEFTTFDRIVSHLSFPFPEMDLSDFNRLIEFFRDSIKDNGLIIISVHNTAIALDGDIYDRETDEFRSTLISKFKSKFGRKVVREVKSKKIQQGEFVSLFEKNGLRISSQNLYTYNLTMRDRIRMWSTPAVLNSIFDLGECHATEVNKIMDEMTGMFGGNTTPPFSSIVYTIAKKHNKSLNPTA